MADILLSGKLTTNSTGGIIVDADKVAYESELVGSGLMQYEKLKKSVKSKIDEVESVANEAKTTANNVKNIIDTLTNDSGSGSGDITPTQFNMLASRVSANETSIQTHSGKISALEEDVRLLNAKGECQVNDVQVKTNSQQGYTSVVNNKVAKIDLSSYDNRITALENKNPSTPGITEETDPVWQSEKGEYVKKSEIDIQNIVYKSELETSINTNVDNKLENYKSELVYGIAEVTNSLTNDFDTTKEIAYSTQKQMNDLQDSIDNATVNGEVTIESVTNLSQRITDLENTRFIGLITEEDYLTLGEFRKNNFLYLIYESDEQN